ncbi:SusC/RagA family TonB-linked outer membrane protein [Chitinophaga parva]|uniref:SusC/RagA family TonB-linked outer membrane protein n=1 Tax=Chitinophaga parva TaxID=2169414 RepID=A0A2T7BLK0_9BACT|nr:SusC/RagA family TonB-linked outer membrane protein [Chitinophaga parva]PUZ28552.1 SusC/RagA family TonB-linked outer membrane protein [Chitinophaga parva]
MRAHKFVRQRTRYRIAYTGRILVLFLLLFSPGLLQAKEIQYPAISIQLKQVPLSTALLKLQEASHYGVLFHADDVIKYGKPVTISVKKQPLPKVLNLLFEHQPFTYHITDSYITVAYKSPESIIPKSETNQVGDTSSITITGHISSEKGEPLAGATVMVKGTQIGAITDGGGDFVIKNVPISATSVQVHILGYKTLEIVLNGSRRLAIRLQQATNSLDETVILAYGNTSKRLNTGSISGISADKIFSQSVGNVLSALEGRLPGLYISQNSGVPGASMNVVVRGIGSISSSANPLYVIDGVPFTSNSIGSTAFSSSMTNGGNPMNSINPSDIESIEVLKDADATSIYGSRGANGVILVTTKKGKPGKTTANFSAYTGISQVAKFKDVLDTRNYLQMRREAYSNDGTMPNPASAPDLLVWDSTKNNNWQKRLIGNNAHITDLQATLSSGNATTQFLIGSGYHHETTVFPGDYGDKRGSAYINLSHLSENNKFKASITANYSSEINDLFYTDITNAALTLPPNAPDLIDKTGALVWPPSISNPYAYEKQTYKATTNNLLSSAQLGYMLFPFLELKLNGGFTRMQMDEIKTIPLSSLNPATNTNANTSSLFGNGSTQTWIIEPQLAFTKSIQNGVLQALMGSTFQQDVTQSNAVLATGYSDDALMESMAAAGTLTPQSVLYSKYKYNALFARINYNYKDRYILNLTGRRDGSSRFGRGKQFANFGSVGATWIFSDEKWIRNHFSLLSFGKLRASYGSTGNDRIGDYQYLSNWYPTMYPYNGIAGLHPANIAVPDYSWETTKKLEVGLSFGFWDNRLIANADYYRNRSSNQLVNYNLPPSAGFTTVIANFPALVQNKGWEIDITSINIKSSKFSWRTSANVTIPNNKLVSFPGLETSAYSSIYIIGQPLTIQRTFHVAGVDPATGIYQFQSGKDGSYTTYPQSPQDLISSYNLSPKIYGGLDNELRYKNWALDFFIQAVKQEGYSIPPVLNPGFISNQPQSVMARWQHPGDQTTVQKFSMSGQALIPNIYAKLYGDAFYEDASFIRLKNVQLSYSLPTMLLNRVSIHGCSLYLRGQNLLTITSFSGLDPEVNARTNNPVLPTLRTLTAGIQLTL